MDTILNKKSGKLGVSGVTALMIRDIEAAAKEGNERAKLAIDSICISSYCVICGKICCIKWDGVDVISICWWSWRKSN